MRRSPLLLSAALFFCAATPSHLSVTVVPSGEFSRTPLSGRVLVFAVPASGKVPAFLEPGFVSKGFTITGFELAGVRGTVPIPQNADSFGTPVDRLEPGTYDMQAVLDVKHMYSYDGLEDGDITGPVVRVHVSSSSQINVPLNHRVSNPPFKQTKELKLVDVVSPRLSKFYGAPTHLRAGVVLPDGYDPHRKYPIVYWQNGFGGNYRVAEYFLREKPMMRQDGLNAIVVVTDSSGPAGITQFADSSNNGPWGEAFIKELIPAVERRFPIDTPEHRFLWGHSSGGWATLWLLTTYPQMFGGGWASSPDPVDFHDFTGPDLLTSPPDNMYFDHYRRPWQLVRAGSKYIMTLRDFVMQSIAEGYTESQFGSFDAVFSPRGPDGKPVPLFDKRTGVVNKSVADYWEAHYDIASNIERNYVALAPFLQHKLHVAVGTLDTFQLERGVLRLDARLRRLRMVPDITYFQGGSHGSGFTARRHFEAFHWAFRGMAAAAAR